MSFFQRIFGETKQREPLQPLYRAIVAKGRVPAWYREGHVPDTLDGRFDMIAAVLSLVLLRLEQEGEARRDQTVLLSCGFPARELRGARYRTTTTAELSNPFYVDQSLAGALARTRFPKPGSTGAGE